MEQQHIESRSVLTGIAWVLAAGIVLLSLLFVVRGTANAQVYANPTGTTSSVANGPANISLSPSFGGAGSTVIVAGAGFTPSEHVALSFNGANMGSATADAGGNFSQALIVPQNATPGNATVSAMGQTSQFNAVMTFTVGTGIGGSTFSGQSNTSSPQTTASLEERVAALEARVAALEAGMRVLFGTGGGAMPSSGGIGAASSPTGQMPAGDTLYTGTAADTSNIGNGTFTLTGDNCTTYTVNIAQSATVWNNARQDVAAASFSKGDSIRLDGSLQSDGSVSADVLRDTSI